MFDDLVNEVAPKFDEADGLVVGSPVYYGSPNGNIIVSFQYGYFFKLMKVLVKATWGLTKCVIGLIFWPIVIGFALMGLSDESFIIDPGLCPGVIFIQKFNHNSQPDCKMKDWSLDGWGHHNEKGQYVVYDEDGNIISEYY